MSDIEGRIVQTVLIARITACGPAGDPGISEWGEITGDIESQTDLVEAINAKVADEINNDITDIAPSQNAVYDALASKEPSLPATPDNPDIKFLNGNREWANIAIGAGGYAANLYFTTVDSDISGYKKISYTNLSSETELPASVVVGDGDKLLRTYLFDEALGVDAIDAGVWIVNFRAKVSNAVGITKLKLEVFVRHIDDSETVLFSAYGPEINNTDYETIRAESNQPQFDVASTDRLGVRSYANTTSGATVTITSIVGGTNSGYFTTPLSIRHNQLRGLTEGDDHPQYLLKSGGTMTGSLTIGANGTDTAVTKIGNTSGDELYIGTNSAMRIQRSAGGSEVWRAQINGDSQGRLLATSSGVLQWGSGSAAQDTNLYRSAANTLKTDDAFVAAGITSSGNIVVSPSGTPLITLTTSGSIIFSSGFSVSGAGVMTFPNSGSISAGTTTGLTIGSTTSQKLGFWANTPVVQSSGWATSNVASTKILDADSTTIDELADVVGSLIDTLKSYGLLGG